MMGLSTVRVRDRGCLKTWVAFSVDSVRSSVTIPRHRQHETHVIQLTPDRAIIIIPCCNLSGAYGHCGFLKCSIDPVGCDTSWNMRRCPECGGSETTPIRSTPVNISLLFLFRCSTPCRGYTPRQHGKPVTQVKNHLPSR